MHRRTPQQASGDDGAIVLGDVYLPVEFARGGPLVPRPQLADDLGDLCQVGCGGVAEVEVLEGVRVVGDRRTEDHSTTVIERLALPLGFHGSSPETTLRT